nr:hypothetical protein HK105_001612 [Polyrhizophydium stewartii]
MVVDGVFFAGEKFTCVLTFTNALQHEPPADVQPQPHRQPGFGSLPRHDPAAFYNQHPDADADAPRRPLSQPPAGRPSLTGLHTAPHAPGPTTADSDGHSDSGISSFAGSQLSSTDRPPSGLSAQGSRLYIGNSNSSASAAARHGRSFSESVPVPPAAGDPIKRSTFSGILAGPASAAGPGISAYAASPPASDQLGSLARRDRGLSIGNALRSLAGSFFGSGVATPPADAASDSHRLSAAQMHLAEQQRHERMLQERLQVDAGADPRHEAHLASGGVVVADAIMLGRPLTSPDALPGSSASPASASASRETMSKVGSLSNLDIPAGLRNTTSLSNISDAATPGTVEFMSPMFPPNSAQSSETPLAPWNRTEPARSSDADSAADQADLSAEATPTMANRNLPNMPTPTAPSETAGEDHELEDQVTEEGGRLFLQAADPNAPLPPGYKRRSLIRQQSADELGTLVSSQPTDDVRSEFSAVTSTPGRFSPTAGFARAPLPLPPSSLPMPPPGSLMPMRIVSSPAQPMQLAQPPQSFGHAMSVASSDASPFGSVLGATHVPGRAGVPSRIKQLSADIRALSMTGVREEIAWAFAQMTGQFSVDPAFIKTAAFAPLRSKVMYRAAGSSGGGVQGGGGSMGMGVTRQASGKSDAQALPLYSTPPSILFCDESLAPGESKSFKYEIMLPAVLPPSHRGRVVRFFYKLIVGIQRSGKSRQSQIISIPFRVFNRTNYNGSRPVYEIMNPVIVNKDEATVTAVAASARSSAFSPVSPGGPLSNAPSLSAQNSANDFDEFTTTINNIMNVCQSSKKVSYEICKNNEHVAQVTLPRIAYRLGETIAVVLNFTKGSIPCFQVSVFLESIENVDSSFLAKSKQQTSFHTRKCHTELHRSTLNARRLVLSVMIPATATADFQSTAVSVQWSLRLEFVTGKSGQLHRAVSAPEDGFRHFHGFERADAEPFDCTIPLKVYGGMRALRRNTKRMSFPVQ